MRAPGVAALLRRHPRALRGSAVGAIAAGTVLFVVASVLTPGASAETRRPAAHPAARAAEPSLSVLLPTVSPSSSPSPISAVASAAPSKKKPIKAVDVSVSTLAGNGIPTVALNAYRVAAARMASAEPSCGIDWALLAGIGRVESDHGRFGGAVLHSDGTSSPKIVGPALNGHGTALIYATPEGLALDGDPIFTHALGPMQFIPQTWDGYGADADGDGKANIFDVNDAALGAARYLCAAGGNLRTPEGQRRAVGAYNHVDTYVTEVLALADAYRRGIPISGVPIGKLTGALPPVHKTGTAANPGSPTALHGKHTTTPGGSSGPTSSPGHPSTSPTSGSSPGSSSSPTPTPTRSPTPSPSPTSSHSPTPSSSPTPSPTCHIPLGNTCLVP